MTKVNKVAGIDISKACFDICLLSNGEQQHQRFSNDASGINAAAQWLPADTHCVMEVTGPYYTRLALHLHGQGFAVSVINPLVIKRFSQMRLRRAKTDKADAKMIARYALTEQPACWTPPKPYAVTLQQLDAVHEQLTRQAVALGNQLEAFTQSGLLEKQTAQFLESTLEFIAVQQQRIEAKIQALIQAYHSEMLRCLTTIPGIGKKTAILLIVLSDGFKKFASHKQLTAYVGLSPRIYESGSSIKGRTKLCKMGMSRIRALLYLCAWSAKRCNPACKALYQRLVAKGKAKRLALIAVAHKLLKQAFAIATAGKPYLIQP